MRNSAQVLSPPAEGLPAMILADDPRQRLELWLQDHWPSVEGQLVQYGAVAFRGFACGSPAAFGEAIQQMGSSTLRIKEESSRRVQLGEGIFTATEHPADFDIFLHHESSYSLTVPARVFFFCAGRDGQGGETLLADGHRIWTLIRPEIRQRFDRLGWALHRRYGDGLGVSWQQAYATDKAEDVNAYCLEHGTQARWVDGELMTRQQREVTLKHPTSGLPVWFNHICFFHRSAIPADLLGLLMEEGKGLPFDTTYGNDEPIELGVVEELRSAYRACSVCYEWRAGDVLVLDNLRIAHGRRAFSGSRSLLFAAADPVRVPACLPHAAGEASGN
jgi:alpha-ketoglutarate-dependent taurine dioxygenase